MVSPRQQRRTCRRADCCGVEGVVTDAAVGDPAQGRRVNATADGIGLGEAGIVEHDDQNVRRVLRQVRRRLPLLVP